MRETGLLRLFDLILKYPLYAVAFVGFAVMHHCFANRLGCYGFVRNLLYTVACLVAATAMFFMGVLLVRHTGVTSQLVAQLVGGFAFSAIVVAAGRILFRTQPPAPKTVSSSSELPHQE